MGKSPGKWIKTVLFGKKSSKSNLSKDATIGQKTSITINPQSKDLGDEPTMISSPVPPVTSVSEEHTQLEKSSSANLTHDTTENIRSNLGLDTANADELLRLEQAATKAQAAFRGYLARRAFWALKGIIRLQALVRGHLVRRQAVATLSCMRAIVEFQALVRGQKVRLSTNTSQVLQKRNPGESVDKKRADLLQASLKSEKLSTNAFAVKLVNSSKITNPLSIQYDPTEPNSVKKWLERWSCSHFWEPLPPPKKALNVKPKRKQIKSQHEETETTKPKRSVRRISATNPEYHNNNNLSNSSETEKPKRTTRKASTIQTESVQEQSHSELEKVKRSLRKISVSAPEVSEKSEVVIEKVNDVMTKTPEVEQESEPVVAPPLEDKPVEDVDNDNPAVEAVPPGETEVNVENVESGGKENQKTRRRKSLPVKQEYSESVSSQNASTLPSYMAATESAKAKLRAQAAAKAAEDGGENGFVRRHSLPSGKVSLQSPRVQKPLQVNGKGAGKINKPQIAPRDEKVLSAGWKR